MLSNFQRSVIQHRFYQQSILTRLVLQNKHCHNITFWNISIKKARFIYGQFQLVVHYNSVFPEIIKLQKQLQGAVAFLQLNISICYSYIIVQYKKENFNFFFTMIILHKTLPSLGGTSRSNIFFDCTGHILRITSFISSSFLSIFSAEIKHKHGI